SSTESRHREVHWSDHDQLCVKYSGFSSLEGLEIRLVIARPWHRSCGLIVSSAARRSAVKLSKKEEDSMKLKKSVLPVFMITAAVGLSGTSLAWDSHSNRRAEFPSECYPTSVEDDQSMPPGIPGVTEINPSDMSTQAARMVQQAVAVPRMQKHKINFDLKGGIPCEATRAGTWPELEAHDILLPRQ
ncbi:MAG TPA: hypothetical protein VMT22_11185, partial [Terriglobales bacterium]|nr:hypothetical protein [Terriglobales bacterium]